MFRYCLKTYCKIFKNEWATIQDLPNHINTTDPQSDLSALNLAILKTLWLPDVEIRSIHVEKNINIQKQNILLNFYFNIRFAQGGNKSSFFQQPNSGIKDSTWSCEPLQIAKSSSKWTDFTPGISSHLRLTGSCQNWRDSGWMETTTSSMQRPAELLSFVPWASTHFLWMFRYKSFTDWSIKWKI